MLGANLGLLLYGEVSVMLSSTLDHYAFVCMWNYSEPIEVNDIKASIQYSCVPNLI